MSYACQLTCGQTCVAPVAPTTHLGQTCADELRRTAPPGQTCADELGQTCVAHNVAMYVRMGGIVYQVLVLGLALRWEKQISTPIPTRSLKWLEILKIGYVSASVFGYGTK